MLARTYLTLALGVCLATAPSFAGEQYTSPSDKKAVIPEEPVSTWFPDRPLGLITLGGIFSESLSGGFFDSNTGIWASKSRESFFFLNSRYQYEDNGQFRNSTGLAFRQMLPGRDVIIGLNVQYDSINSERDHDYNSYGVGFELLTRWVDARFNYYLPEDKKFEVDRFNKRERFTNVGPSFSAGGLSATFTQEVNRRRSFKTFEQAVEGLDAELGFLIPGLDKYAEVRLFGGYERFNDPFGRDIGGFKARLEARLLPGVILDGEYHDDDRLSGGHWAAGVRVSLPFSFAQLLRGKNPFEGAAEEFRPGPRPFKDRMSEMIIRSPRIQTVTSGGFKTRDTTDVQNNVVVAGPGIPTTTIPFE